MDELQKEVKELFDSHHDIEEVEAELLQKGHLKEDIDSSIHQLTTSIRDEKHKEKNAESRKFFLKELFDRVGYGLGSEQYINILFMQSGAGLPLIAAVAGIKSLISSIASSFIKDYSEEKGVDKRMISFAGVLYGFCFILMSAGVLLHSPILFIIAILTAALSVVSYGESYQQFMEKQLSQHKTGLMRFMYTYGLMITVLSLAFAAFLMDRFDLITIAFPLSGKIISFSFLSYLAVFEFAALSFILSGYVISQLKSDLPKKAIFPELMGHIPNYLRGVRSDLKQLWSNRPLMLLLLATSLTGFVQLLGNSFYGIYIYQHFSGQGFGGYLNVAMISILALMTALLTPLITKENTKTYGKYPMLIFGTLLMAIMPLAFYFNPNLISLGMATILGVMGAAIMGIAEGMLFSEIAPKEIREGFFGSSTLLTIFPYILLIPLGTFLVSAVGLNKLFLLLGLTLIVVVFPLCMLLMLTATKRQNFN